MKMRLRTKRWMVLAMVLAILLSYSAAACTSIYLGSNLTEDGSTIFARSEDVFNGYNKRFYVSPAGVRKAGEVYNGCYGFSHTFTHDSYSYTAFSDDNGAAVGNICPDCGSSHVHAPYEAAGTNEKGLTVSATETLYAAEAVLEVDPYNLENGIEEAEITTILLSECATVREAIDLLLGIYDSVGCQSGSGIFVGDYNETWYIENISGSQYVALKLNADVAFTVPNQSAIGLIDLDDAENVIASDALIAVAQRAGTYVGDAAENTIHFAASYDRIQTANVRMVNALKYFNASASDAPVQSDFTLSNVDAGGNIVPLYSNIVPDRVFSIEDVVGFYRIEEIGMSDNTSIHIFQNYDRDDMTDTVEWVAMDHGMYTVFVPHFPMLTSDTYAGYQVSTLPGAFHQEQPDEGLYYPSMDWNYDMDSDVASVEGFRVPPENWMDSMYWAFDYLSNLAECGGLTDARQQMIREQLDALQDECYMLKDRLYSAAVNAASTQEAVQACTELSTRMAARVHSAVVELVNSLGK